MLRGAIQQHEKENQLSKSESSAKPTAQSNPPYQPPRQTTMSGPSFTGALKPTPSSALNAQKVSEPRGGFSQGVKRMSNGLAKAVHASFEDSHAAPIAKTMPTPQIIDLEAFDVDDFDSDIDLDFEEPKQVSYPPLPSQSQKKPSSPLPKPVVYPSLPRQQQVQTTYLGSRDDHPEPTAPAPNSSMPLPWSSSPAEHWEPRLAESNTMSQILRDKHRQQAGSSQSHSSGPRRLPWLKDDTGEQAPDEPSKAQAVEKPFATPARKDAKKLAQPWNTSASAVKEQQKKHREEVRKAVKKNEGTAETVSKAKSQRKKVPKVFLSEEQQHVLNLVIEQKKSVFFTGSAGTGKSVLLREIISSLSKTYARESDRVAVTASTGLAACNVGGVTLHSFAGIGLGKEDTPELVRKIKRNQKAKQRWLRTKVLVIDEVSMVDADLFDKLEAIARQLRNNGRPFGGIQLVITGDFFQLPPVPDSGRVSRFAFDAATWNTTIEHTIGLHQVFRQKDPIFAGMLNEMREGRLSDSSVKAFRNLSRDLKFEDAISATELFPLRSEVERANTERLSMLQGQQYVFEARDGGSIVDKVQRDKLLQNCMAAQGITLKKGAQVMLIKNIDEHLVNGSIGRVIAFMDETEFDKFRINEEAYAQQADGVFVSQGMEELSKEEKARRRLQDNLTTSRKYPLVRFVVPDGSSRDLLCQPESWKVELPNGEIQASRSQIPLILAWALSIHKAQGQTLERVKVDLGKVFEKGQAYVALSRATSMAGLQVLRFDPRKVNAHDRVRTFYSNLARVQSLADAGGKVEEKKGKQGSLAGQYEQRFLEGDDDF